MTLKKTIDVGVVPSEWLQAAEVNGLTKARIEDWWACARNVDEVEIDGDRNVYCHTGRDGYWLSQDQIDSALRRI